MARGNWLRNLFVKEVSLVDRPANPSAVVLLTKRDEGIDDSAYEKLTKRTFTAEERRQAEANGHAMPGGRYPINDKSDLEHAIHAIGRGNGSHESIRRHIITRARALGATDMLPEEWNVTKQETITKARAAFENALTDIAKDATITDKAAAYTAERTDFVAFLAKQNIEAADIEKAADEIASIVEVNAGNPGFRIVKGDSMSDAIKKALGLSATATEAEVIAALSKRDEDLKKANDELVIAKMSDKHKAYHAKLSGDAKDKFAAMSPAERDKTMGADDDADCEKALAKGDAFKATDGHVFHKRDFGTDAAYHFAKSQNETIAKQAEEIAKAKEDKAVADFAKRAKDTFGDEAFGATLRKAYAGDAAAQAEVEKRTAALKKQADEGGLFVEKGGRGSPAAGSAEAELLAKRDELRKANPKLSDVQAFSKVYSDRANVDLVKRYKAEQGLPA